VAHRLAAKSPEGLRQPGREIPTPPGLSVPPEVRDVKVERPAVASNVLRPLLPLLSVALRSTATQHGPILLKERSSRQVQPDLRIRFLRASGWALPGPATIPMASAGARGDCQDVRGSAPGRAARAEGGGPTLGRATVMDPCQPTGTRPIPG
jgi:hypothetical protein